MRHNQKRKSQGSQHTQGGTLPVTHSTPKRFRVSSSVTTQVDESEEDIEKHIQELKETWEKNPNATEVQST